MTQIRSIHAKRPPVTIARSIASTCLPALPWHAAEQRTMISVNRLIPGIKSKITWTTLESLLKLLMIDIIYLRFFTYE